MSTIVGAIKRLYAASNASAPKSPDALRFGILGAARIAPDALIKPGRSHPEVIVEAVAARDRTKAEKYAKQYGIPRVYAGPNGYQELLDDPDIDIVYNPLPNGLHYEWTMKALAAGKHVLLEKPSTDTAEETQKLFEYAGTKGLVLLEAFHYRFHPTWIRFKEIIDSAELGKVKSLSAALQLPSAMRLVADDDIRFNYDLGGGIMMDMGCYPLSAVRCLASAEPTEVTIASAAAFQSDPRVDMAMSAVLVFPNDISADITCHSRWPGWGPLNLLPRMPSIYAEAKCEGGTIKLSNFIMPHLFHSITVQPREGRKRVETVYTHKPGGLLVKGEEWWSTYRYQLEAFVDKVKGREPHAWMSAQDSIANMHWVEKVYEKAGLGSRPASNFVVVS